MSRNLRDRPRARAASKTTAKGRALAESSDDDYAGVDLISDSDEDEPDVERAEEQAIIESEEEADDESDDAASPPRPQTDDDQTSWAGFELDEPALDEYIFDPHSAAVSASSVDVDSEAAIWNALNDTSDDDGSSTPRRVRFDLTDSSASLSDHDDIFPDIFLDQNSLNPNFRRAIERDANDDGGESSDASYWDVQGSDDNVTATPDAHESVSDESSGYETDEGETTEEDLPPAAKSIPARSVLRRMSSDSSASEEVEVVRRRPLRPSQRSFPKLASWVHDASRPFAVIDSRGKRLIMFKARTQRSFSFPNGHTPPGRALFDDSDLDAGMEQLSPLISNSGNLMMSALFAPGTFSDMGGQVLGPPEAFYPFTSVDADGIITQESISSLEDDEIDDEDLWNVEDFVNFGEDDSSDDEDEAGQDVDASASEMPSSTPVRPSTAASDDQVHSLLTHFESGVVGAFRRNQTRHNLLSRNATTHEGLAFSNPYHHGPLRGVKGGRLEAVNVPITPVRRQRALFPGAGSNAGSPVAATQKRKFSGDMPTHKRSRSLL